MAMVKEIFSYFLVFVMGFLVSGLVQYAVKSYFKKTERHYYPWFDDLVNRRRT